MQWTRSIRSLCYLKGKFEHLETLRTYRILRIHQATSVINDEGILNILKSPTVTTEQWNYVRSNVISKYSIQPESVYLTLVQNMQKFGIPIGVKAFRLYNFLVENKYPLNPGAKMLYLQLCIQHYSVLMNADREQMKRVCDELSQDLVGSNLEARLLMLEALCFTDQWQEVFKKLEDESLAQKFPDKRYTVAAFTAFYHKRYDLGWKYVNEAYEKNSFVHPRIFMLYLEKCAENNQTFKSNMFRCFQFFAKYGIILPYEVAMPYVKKFRAMGFDAHYTTIFRTGYCEHCNKKLKQIHLSKEDLDNLANVIFDCIAGKDVYLKTKPDELNKFKNFIDKTHFDVIIDGLNLLYRWYSGNGQRLRQQLSQLLKLSNYPPLVISRFHVKNDKSFKRIMEELKATPFYVDNNSCDDLFFIYAALRGGPNAKLITGDHIRNHTSVIEDRKIVFLFTRWILAHRYIISNNQDILPPLGHDPITQNCGGFWHVPYTKAVCPSSDYVLGTRTSSEWLCVKL